MFGFSTNQSVPVFTNQAGWLANPNRPLPPINCGNNYRKLIPEPQLFIHLRKFDLTHIFVSSRSRIPKRLQATWFWKFKYPLFFTVFYAPRLWKFCSNGRYKCIFPGISLTFELLTLPVAKANEQLWVRNRYPEPDFLSLFYLSPCTLRCLLLCNGGCVSVLGESKLRRLLVYSEDHFVTLVHAAASWRVAPVLLLKIICC